MVFLDNLDNGQMVRTPCMSMKSNTLDRDILFILPTKDEEVMISICDNFKNGIGNYKIRKLNAIYSPWKKTFKAGAKQIKWINKDTGGDSKRFIARGYTRSTSYNTKLKTWNVCIDSTKIIEELMKVKYTKANLHTFWNALLDSWDLTHKKKYLLFTKDITLLKINNINSIKVNDIQPTNLWINFLFMLKYDYDKITKMMIDKGFSLLVTDNKSTFSFDFSKNTMDKKDTIKFLMKNLRKMYLGLEIDENEEESMLELDEDGIIDENETAISVKKLDEKKINKIVQAKEIKSTKIVVDDNDIVSDSIDKLENVIEDDKLDSMMLKEKEISNEIDKKEKKDKALEDAKKISEIVQKSKPTPVPLDIRGHKLGKRQTVIKERNLVEIMADIEKLSEGIEAKEINIDSKFNRFRIYDYDTQYANQSKKDRMDIGQSMSTNTVPLFMTNYNESIDEKSNDTYCKNVQYTFESPDSTKEKHTFTIKVPELREGRYLYINGSDKVMIRQKMALPIIHLEDSVVFTTYYNKMFVTLSSGNITKKSAKIKKFITYIRKNIPFSKLASHFTFTPVHHKESLHNNISAELLEVSRYISKIYIDENNYFDITDIKDKIVGKIQGNNIYHNNIDNFYYDNDLDLEFDILFIFDTLIRLINDETTVYWNSQIINKKASDNITSPKIKMLGRNIDLVVVILHAYSENLLELLNHLKDDYELEYVITPFDDKPNSPKFKDDDGSRFIFDGFTLDIKYNTIANRCLLAPLTNLDLTEYKTLNLLGITEDIIESSNTVMYMDNFKDLFIDPITKEVMEDMGLPSNYSDALIYCNKLLFEYDRTISSISLRNERMPSNSEIIQGVCYKQIADAYADYANKKRRGSKNAVFSVKKDAVLTELVTLPNVEESSKINPVQSVDKTLTISNKGVSGINNDRSYTPPKRKWDKSFYGIMSDVSPYTKASGVSKHLAVNPNITTKRGYFNETEIDDVSIDMIMSVSEVLGPFAQRHDSTPRLAMGMMQFNHLIGTEGSDVSLVTYGADSALSHLDVDFAHSMPDDCEIIEANERFIKVRFNNLKENDKPLEKVYQINKIERNSAKAFYVPNEMEVNPEVKIKVGSKIKKDTILMYNKNVYQYHGGDIVFKSGPIVNVAIANCQNSYEDAVLVSESLATKLKTKTIKRVAVKLNNKNRIMHAVRDLIEVNPGDELFKYAEDTGSDYINANMDLSLLNESLLKIKESHYKGRIFDIFIYYKLSEQEKKELDPSIKKFIKDINSLYEVKYNTNKLKENINGVDSNREIEHVTEFTGSKRNKINGDSVDRGIILIEYFIEVEQPFTTGDKITVGNTALKGVCSKIVEDDKKPYGFTSKRPVDLILSPISPLARMVYSSFINGVLSEIMVKMNNDLKDMVNK